MYGLKADAIVGYTYRAENLCPTCVVEVTHYSPHGNPAGRRLDSAEQHLDVLARLKGIDRTDEHSFDSDDFPKVILAVQVEDDERCSRCNEPLIP